MTNKSADNSRNLIDVDQCMAAVNQTMQDFDYEEHALVEVLITVQESYGYLPEEVLIYVSDKLRLPLSQVHGVATFYDMFTFEVVGATDCKICTGPVCAIAGAGDVLKILCKYTDVPEPGRTSSDGMHSITTATCLGLCDQAPAALVNKQAQVNLSPSKVPAMLRGQARTAHLQVTGEPRVLTRLIGELQPTDLDAHLAEGSFSGLEKALRELTPEQVIAEVTESRLAGRGGAGFPTGKKWEFVRNTPSSQKFVVCNFDESEPGTFKDRVLMEGDPFRVLEGLIISAYATAAESGYIYIRGEYPAATEIVEDALNELYSAHYLGDHVQGTDFSFDVEIRHNAGAYICGEETALFESIEGKRGHPRLKPPYPTQAGLFGMPTVINNVETLSVVPDLVLNGGEWFHQWGTPQSVGLKLFCLSGHVRQPGVVEAPYGLTVRELVEQFGGGFDGEPQAILIGGATGGFLHPDHLNTPLTNEDLYQIDVPIGSGAIMVFNQSVNLWEVLEGLAHFFVHETCGLCAPCRLGTKQIYRLLNKVTLGTATPSDLRKIEDAGQTITSTCKCGLGMTAANPVMTVLHHFDMHLPET